MNIHSLDHTEITRLAQELASYSSMGQAFEQGGTPDHLRGANAASHSALIRLAEEFGYDLEGKVQ